ncbi:MAG: cyclic nucleotide-binding domain-containing protein [Deltaproteobacteria bacterium]|jgi:CRP/FNR family transcriptional regulator, cyclic AMP receptor protein|nr:cyclic nucleotide-binding domain-containing protein [Deltaproteobacteria bacterium]
MRKVLYILGGLDDNDVEWLIAGGERRRVTVGEVLISEGKMIEALYILLEGELAASIKTHKGPRELGKMSVGDMVGEISLVDDRPASATVTVVRDAHVLAVPRTALLTQLKTDIGFAARFYHAVAQMLSYRLRDNTALIAGEGAAPVPELEKEEDLLGMDVLDNVHMAGQRFSRIMRRLAG